MNKTEEFVEKARKIHADKYDYRLFKYVRCDDKSIIICPIEGHGEFLKTPGKHINAKQGCPKCSKDAMTLSRRFTKEQFIERSREKHGNKYDYSKVVYVNSTVKIIIICPDHGDFEQRANGHLKGRGCSKCAITKNALSKSDKETFVARARSVHGDRYNYDQVNYTNNRTKIIISCPDHGNFTQTPTKHLQGRKCQKCSGFRRYTTEEWIEGAKIKHNELYSYPRAVYVNSYTKIIITCKTHGDFKQVPYSHMQGAGCPECAGGCPYTTSEWITAAKIKHNNLYSYPRAIYVNSHTKIIITCEEHGDFEQDPYSHLGMGSGCPKCRYSKLELGIMSFLDNNNIVYKCQKRFKDCVYKYTLPFDFYIKSIKVLIEGDGRQHRQPVECFGGDEAFEKQQIKDKIKTDYASNNGMKLVRIRDVRHIAMLLGPHVKLYHNKV